MSSSLYGLLTYLAWPEYNVGDYIQSLAAKQFLPRTDKYINRERLSEYNGADIKMILNGWFMHRPANWPPSPRINAFVTSFHLNSQCQDHMFNKVGQEWFRKHEPIGCRDPFTLELMTRAGIKGYLSGCLTTTFVNTFDYRTDDIYFVDVLFRVPGLATSVRTPREFIKSIISGDLWEISKRAKLLQRLFSVKLLKAAKTLSHYHPARHSDLERFTIAAEFLEKYATAKLVVTSRLHCALPCLAFGTPVIFIHSGFKDEFDKCRLNGVTDLFNTIYIDEKANISSNFLMPAEKISADIRLCNPERFRPFVEPLRNSCTSFIKEVTLQA